MNADAAGEAVLTGLAQSAGAHALAWYFGLLALLLAAELVAWSARTLRPHRLGNGSEPMPRRAVALGLGVALVLCAGALFAGIAHEVGAGDEFVRVDRAFLEATRAHATAGTVRQFGWVTLLGDGLTLGVLCIAAALLLLQRGRPALALAMVAAVAGNGLLNAALKRSFERMRPPHEAGLPLAHGWSFPSGHASGAVAAYGMLAYVLIRTLPRRWHLPAVMAATALAFSIGWSRIFLDVHFASDVLAAYASGIAWLVLCLVVTELLGDRRDRAAMTALPRAWWRAHSPSLPALPATERRVHALADGPHSIALLIAGFTLLRLLLAGTLPLLPEEAYYWSWSRHLDWSYFDHPPLATYSIALTTAVFGQTVFGIKLASTLWALGWNLLWARLILDMYSDRRLAFWTLAALNLTVVYEAFGVGPTPDAPLIFAWTGAIWATWKVSQTGDGRWWLAAGAFIGLSWLGKYSGVLLLPVVLLYLLSSARQRHWLGRPQPWLAALLALAIFAPVLYWNAQNDWASFAFQGSRRVGEMSGFKPRYFALLIATQFLLLTPYGFVVSFGALWRGAKDALARRLDDRARLLLLSGAVPIVLFTLISMRSLVKANWLAPAYWSLMILGVRHVLSLEGGTRRLVRGLASSAALLALAGIVVAVPNVPIPGALNSWSGWEEIALRADRAAASAATDAHPAFIFSPNYRASSMLRFYLPGQARTYAQDIYGEAALQFDHFPLPRDMKGDTGILVLTDQDQRSLDRLQLGAYFDAVERVDVIETKAFGKVTRRTEIYRCTNYKGHPLKPAAAAAGAAGESPHALAEGGGR